MTVICLKCQSKTIGKASPYSIKTVACGALDSLSYRIKARIIYIDLCNIVNNYNIFKQRSIFKLNSIYCNNMVFSFNILLLISNNIVVIR